MHSAGRRPIHIGLIVCAGIVSPMGMGQEGGGIAGPGPVSSTIGAKVDATANVTENVTENVDASQLLKEAAALIRVGDAARALVLLMPLSETAGWEPAFWLGTAHLALGEHDAAADYLDASLRSNAELAHIWVQRAIVEQERNRPSSALSLLAVARQLAPDFPDTYINAGYAYETLDQPESARRAYRQFLSLSALQAMPKGRREDVLARLTPGTQALPLIEARPLAAPN